MKTNEEFVSRVIGNFKALTKDGRMPKRHALSIGQDKAKFYMSQKLDELTLFKEDDIISTIPCFEMETVPAVECDIVELRLCKSVMKSVKKIPKGIFGKNGSGILFVFSIDESRKFDYVTIRKYYDIKKMKYLRNPEGYYMIKNGYLYLPDSEVEVLGIQMIALKGEEVATASSCASQEERCKSHWEQPFICPDRFYDLVVRETIMELASFYRTSVEDSNPNLDVNQKGKTEQ